MFTSVWSDMAFCRRRREGEVSSPLCKAFRAYPPGWRIDDLSTTIFFILPSAAVLRGRATRRYEIRRITYTYTREDAIPRGTRLARDRIVFLSKRGKCTKCPRLSYRGRSCRRQRRKDCSPIRRENALTI